MFIFFSDQDAWIALSDADREGSFVWMTPIVGGSYAPLGAK